MWSLKELVEMRALCACKKKTWNFPNLSPTVTRMSPWGVWPSEPGFESHCHSCESMGRLTQWTRVWVPLSLVWVRGSSDPVNPGLSPTVTRMSPWVVWPSEPKFESHCHSCESVGRLTQWTRVWVPLSLVRVHGSSDPASESMGRLTQWTLAWVPLSLESAMPKQTKSAVLVSFCRSEVTGYW